MNKKSKLIIILILFLGILSCHNETPYEKRTHFFKSYLSETFPEFSLKDGEYLFILPGGCAKCKKNMLQIFNNQATYINSHVKGVLLSNNTKLLYQDIDFNQFNNLLVDNSDKIDRMSFGIFGISMLKIEKGVIVGSKSLTPDDFKKGFEFFINKPYQIAK